MRILFVCTGRSGRSQMAKSFAEKQSGSAIEVLCAGDKHHELDIHAVKVMHEEGYGIDNKVEHTIKELLQESFDIIITMCNRAKEICPTFPGSPARIHWAFPDPANIKIRDTSRIDIYRKIRDDIRERVHSLFHFGYLPAIGEMRLIFGSLLNSLTDGVMAHDMDRRIYYFNEAAQRITGYSRADVIGKDCHDVFKNKFCGGDCSFCENKRLTDSKYRYRRNFTGKKGEIRNLEMSVVAVNPPNDKVTGALVIFRDMTEVTHLRKRLEESRGFQGIIGRHISMQKVFDSIRELADVKVPILIQGETGTGKEMVAMALHNLSSRSSGPFVPVNCGALPEGTLESELFGHVKGAFTGALRDRKGRFELAEGGTIFLDEIGEISPAMQVKLLRVLQENSFIPVGGEITINANVRVICATNRNLKLLTQQGLFREDLYYRLAVVPINLPSLDERKSDIRLLVEYFLDKYSVETGKRVHEISPDALKILESYSWPGNVRELSNAVQYAMIKCSNGILDTEHLPPEILEKRTGISPGKPGRPQKTSIENIRETLSQTDGNKAKAAKILGISRTTLYRILEDKNV